MPMCRALARHGVSCLAPRQYSNPSQITLRCYKLYLEATLVLQPVFKGEIVSIMPLKLYPGVIENLRPRRHRARHKCDVDIRMALQSDLIRAVFIQRRPGHFILLPTFNFKLKPLVPAQDVSPCRCLAKRLSGNIIQHVIFNRQIQFANNNTSPVKHE